MASTELTLLTMMLLMLYFIHSWSSYLIPPQLAYTFVAFLIVPNVASFHIVRVVHLWLGRTKERSH